MAEKLAAQRKRIEREKAAAVQEAEAKWRERHDKFKRESIAVLAHSANSLEVQSNPFSMMEDPFISALHGDGIADY